MFGFIFQQKKRPQNLNFNSPIQKIVAPIVVNAVVLEEVIAPAFLLLLLLLLLKRLLRL